MEYEKKYKGWLWRSRGVKRSFQFRLAVTADSVETLQFTA